MKKMFCYFLVGMLALGCSEYAPDQDNYHQEGMTVGNWADQGEKQTIPEDALVMEEELVMKDYLNNLKIIKTAFINMEVKDFKTARNQLDSLVEVYQGFVAGEQASKPADRMETTVTIKLAPQQFYPMLQSIEPLGVKVHSKNINTQDVTQEYTDLEARLQARQDVAKRYKEILKQANSIEQILLVEGKLRSVLEDIESLKGRIKYLSEQVGLSTINVTLFQYLPVADIAEVGFFTKLGHAFTFGWNDILDFVLGIASSWHLILLWGTILYFGIRWIRSRAIFRRVLQKG